MGRPKRLYFIFLLCLLCVRSIVCDNFIPLDRLLINCGSNQTSELGDGRVFEPDSKNPNVGLSAPGSHSISFSKPEIGTPNLYHSARVFTKTSTYRIHTKQPGRHWLRLHFYPVGHSQFNLKSANFSVSASGISLLHGFSFLKMRGNTKKPIFKEYAIEVGGSKPEDLVLTLSPWNGSVAFINGIEVVSMPEGQFPSTAVPIPAGPEMGIPTHVSFQTAYRVNMGGPILTPKNDTLWRTWVLDHPFLINPASARSVSKNPAMIKYLPGVSVETAPNWVYSTAQEMADANVSNQRFNISWVFEVDECFTYVVRMHFCDIVSVGLNNLVFNVYINNQSAIDAFDLSSKTMALSSTYFIDFLVNVSTGSNQILVQVGPTNMINAPTNAILNGLEIMKMSNPSNSLDGNFRDFSMKLKSPKAKINKHLLLIMIISGLCILVVLLLLFVLVLLLCCRRPKKPKAPRPRRQVSSWLSIPTPVGMSDTKVSALSFASTSTTTGLRRFVSFSKICDATKNFDDSLVLGVGGFGKVYKGHLENGVTVAIKRGNPRSQQGLLEFKTEIEMLSKLRHRHLVSLIGYCEDLDEMILVYEFMAGGPLRKHLYGSNLPPLTWKQRLEICIGAAKGLHYLHTGAAESIIHRDVKTTNILLDENLTAKVADFGLSKLGPTLDQTHVSTAVKGSFGYLDPEYFRRQQLTEKSDVYSFGVVLMEVLCARPAINPSLPREQVNIAEWAMSWQKKGRLEQIIDPRLVGSVNLDSLRKFGDTAEKCLAEYGTERPTMGDVLWNLEYALQLQEASIQFVADENSANYIPEISDWIHHVEPLQGVVRNRESDATTTAEVFSQLVDPKGR